MTAVASEKGTYRVSEETRSRLIHAAGELFALRGVEAVTVREIADKADAVPNAVRYHFGDKAGLVAAVAVTLATKKPGAEVDAIFEKAVCKGEAA